MGITAGPAVRRTSACMLPMNDEPTINGAQSAPPAPTAGRARAWKLAAKAVVFAVLAWAVYLAVRKMLAQWQRTGTSFDDLSLDWRWLVPATLCFTLGQLLFGSFWLRLLRDLGIRVGAAQSLWAYTAGTLGKYIPGKAGVVLLRTAMVEPDRDMRIVTGLSAVYEVFTALAVGSLFAGVTLVVSLPGLWVWWGGAFAMAIGFAVGMHPAVFGWVAKLASLTFRNQQRGDLARWSHVWRRWGVLQLLGWVATGLSFLVVAWSLDMPIKSMGEAAAFAGSIALATTIGFVCIFVPSGLVVREMVIVGVLAASFGQTEVLVASCVMRMVSIAGELLAAAVAMLVTRLPVRTSSSTRADPVGGPDVIP